jgi:hypothetical protein
VDRVRVDGRNGRSSRGLLQLIHVILLLLLLLLLMMMMWCGGVLLVWCGIYYSIDRKVGVCVCVCGLLYRYGNVIADDALCVPCCPCCARALEFKSSRWVQFWVALSDRHLHSRSQGTDAIRDSSLDSI